VRLYQRKRTEQVPKLRIIRLSELEPRPWKNGGGVTCEIAALRRADAVVWRLSMADVGSDGPFSRFDGLTRILTVIEGNGMQLISASVSVEALYGAPVRFDGALAIESRLKDGPLRDLNLMFDPLVCDGDVILKTGPCNTVLRAGADVTYAVFVLRGVCRIDTTTELFVGNTLVLESGLVTIDLGEGAEALMITLTSSA
jgi:uncharacterized protein